MDLVENLTKTLRAAGIKNRVTYGEFYEPSVVLDGEWEVMVDGASLEVGLGPYGVSHPEENGVFRTSRPLETPEQVVEYLREHGAC